MFNCFKKRKYTFPIIEDYYDRNTDLEYVQSIAEILKDTNYMLYNIYEYNKKPFAIFIQQYGYPWENNEYYLHTYELPANELNKVCSSNFEIYFKKKTIKLFNINTYKYYQMHGHATKHIELIKQFARDCNVINIVGELDIHSTIGFDNLKHFYEKNGFKVNEYDFSYKNK